MDDELDALSFKSDGSSSNSSNSFKTQKKSADDEITLDDPPTAPVEEGVDIANSSNPDTVIAAGKDKLDKLTRQSMIILARAYAKKSNFMEEIRVMELCQAKNSKDYIVQTLLADAYLHAKKFDEAINAYQTAKHANPRYRPASEGLLAALEAAGEKLDARSLLTEMIKVFGPEPKFYTTLCRLYSMDNFLDKSVEVCTTATEKDSSVPENYVFLGASLKDLEKTDKAVQVFSEAGERFPASETVQSAAGEFNANRKDYASAYRYYKKAVQLNGKSIKALEGLANAAFELQKNDEALGAYVRACQLDRNKSAEIRQAIAKLRSRKEFEWETKYSDSLEQCQ